MVAAMGLSVHMKRDNQDMNQSRCIRRYETQLILNVLADFGENAGFDF